MWPAATYGCKSWTLKKWKKHVLTPLKKRTEKDSAGFVDSKENNEWVLNKAGVKRELLDTVKARKLVYFRHTMRKQGSCLEKQIMGKCKEQCQVHAGEEDHARPGWTKSRRGQDSPWKSIRMTEDRDKWKVRPCCDKTLGSSTAKEQNRRGSIAMCDSANRLAAAVLFRAASGSITHHWPRFSSRYSLRFL